MKIYIASPLGFSEVGREFYGQRLIPAVERLGYRVLDPWKLTSPKEITAVKSMRYGSRKRNKWRRINIQIGSNNRTSEIGYAFAKGKPILGYRGDFRLSSDNEGSLVNLQVEYFIRQSGGEIIARFADLSRALTKIAAVARKGTN